MWTIKITSQMITIRFSVSRQKYDALMKFMFAGEVDLPEYPGLEAVLSRVQVPEDFIECEVNGYKNCFEFIKTLELGCPEIQSGIGTDECRDEADQFLTTFTWTCPTRSGLVSANNLYMVELRTRHPSEHVLTKDMIRCHEMSCHCVGPFYLWGNFEYWIDRQIDGETLRKLLRKLS